MSVKVDIVRSLYGVIEELGKQNIQKDLVTSNLQASRRYLQIILDTCLIKLRSAAVEITDDTILDLCEALLHFMLTASTLPSVRKIEVDKNFRIDLVIPNLHCLLKTPKKALIIGIIRESEDTGRISKFKSLEPNPENIWLISPRPLEVQNLRNYSVFHRGASKKFYDIIIDIDKFLKESGDKSMRLVHS